MISAMEREMESGAYICWAFAGTVAHIVMASTAKINRLAILISLFLDRVLVCGVL